MAALCAFRLAGARGRAAVLALPQRRWSSGAPAEGEGEEGGARPFGEMPGPKALPLVGNVWRFLPLIGTWGGLDFLQLHWELLKEYGKIVKLEKVNENRDMVCMYDANDIEKVFRHEGATPIRKGFESLEYYRHKTKKEKYDGAYGLLSTNGEEWQDFRRRVQPHMLQPRTVAKYAAPIDAISSEFVERLREIRDQNSTLPEDALNWFYRWAFESVAVIALDARVGCLAAALAPHSQQQRLIEAVHVLMDSFFQLDVKPSPWRYVSTPTWRRFVRALDTFEELAQHYIDQSIARIKAKSTTTQDLSGDLSVLEKLLLSNDNPKIATTMATDMVLGGIDTTSHSIIMLLYFISKNPDKQEKLFEELKSILPEVDTPITSEHVQQMKYLRACVKESMRMKPVVIGQIRTNTIDDLVVSNYHIPKGVELIMLTSMASYMEEQVPDARRFLPERWLKGAEGGRAKGHPFASLPFGFGARMCVGRRFAELEIEIVCSKILRNFKVEYFREATFETNFIHTMTSPPTFKLTERK